MTADNRFAQPEGFSWGHFTNAQGLDIRFGHCPPAGETKSVMVHFMGFSEYTEKYFEFVRDMNTRGIDVWLMDWPDQGGSGRYLKDTPERAHSLGYDALLETADQFIRDHVQKADDKPFILSAHSMGAHLGLRYLKEHPGVFDSAIMTAPMLNIPTGNFKRLVAEALAYFFYKFEGGRSTAQDGIGGWSEDKNTFDDNKRTGDRERFESAVDICRRNPGLRKGEPTFAWLYHTFQSMKKLNAEEYLKSIETPILMEISGDDKIVLVPDQERAAKLLPHAEVVRFPQARHEIWQETDSLRNAWLKAVDQFIAGTKPAPGRAAPGPKA